MIVYEPNKNWFRDISNLARSWTMQKILHGILMIGAFATAICFVMYYFQLQTAVHFGIFSLLGVILSILLVFRTNSAYDRWYEGRRLFGNLVNNTRTLALLLQSALPEHDKESRYYLAKHIANFGIALKEHLRKEVKVEELINLTEQELRELSDKQHKPNHIALWIFERIHVVYRAGALTEADLINIKPHYFALIDTLGACERIKKTPIPFSYAVLYQDLYFALWTDSSFWTLHRFRILCCTHHDVHLFCHARA